MKRIICTLCLLLVVPAAHSAESNPILDSVHSAKALLNACHPDPYTEEALKNVLELMCYGYLSGFVDSLRYWQDYSVGYVCLPKEGLSYDLTKAIVVKFLLKNAEYRGDGATARGAVFASLVQEYPCKQKTP